MEDTTLSLTDFITLSLTEDTTPSPTEATAPSPAVPALGSRLPHATLPGTAGSFSQRSSRGGFGRPEPTPAPQPYSFSYDVLDVLGNDYGAAEASNGEQVQGQYSVLLPDGRLQTVSYSVEGDSGFVADVQYEGEARFPDRDGAERGRSSVTRGAGPDAQYGYGRN